jgi:hypothetical protein
VTLEKEKTPAEFISRGLRTRPIAFRKARRIAPARLFLVPSVCRMLDFSIILLPTLLRFIASVQEAEDLP